MDGMTHIGVKLMLDQSRGHVEGLTHIDVKLMLELCLERYDTWMLRRPYPQNKKSLLLVRLR